MTWSILPSHFIMCAQHGHVLVGESPIWGLIVPTISQGQGVHREVESEGSRRQNLGLRYTNHI